MQQILFSIKNRTVAFKCEFKYQDIEVESYFEFLFKILELFRVLNGSNAFIFFYLVLDVFLAFFFFEAAGVERSDFNFFLLTSVKS